MSTFVILAFVFGLVGFSLAAVAFAQTATLKKRIDRLEARSQTESAP
ncbi:hypothetical protein [Salinisphaera sp.]|nr:hypothetical protein [Salinisphaera sp.]